MDCWTGAYSANEAFLPLPLHRKFLGCDLDLECATSSLPQLALIFPCQVMNKKSAITVNDDVQQAVFTFIKGIEEIELKHCIDVGETFISFPIIQFFFLLILHRLSTYDLEYSHHK